MEVSGKLADPTQHNPSLVCIPCKRDCLIQPAFGYCQNCGEYLCKTCVQHHKRAKPSRNHILLDKDAMLQQQTLDDITEVCASHRDKLLEFYCNTHKVVACYVCVTLRHKQCKVDYIPDVSGNVSDEFRSLVTKMEELVKNCEYNIREAQKATKKLDENHEKVIEEIRLCRKEINSYLDKMESSMIQKTESLVNTAKHTLTNIKDTCVEIAEEVKRSQAFLNSLSEENKQNKLFLEMKNVKPRVVTLTDFERQAVEDNKTYEGIEFVRNKKICNRLKLATSFGMISTYNKPSADRALSFQYDRTMKVKSFSDKEKCIVIGMVFISTSQMIVADHKNKND